ncbi:MAG: bifunctional uroporphyrinogen-III C-methyltransferase/uroporphyrinogen-III synthase [Polyangiaceae bacterium]|nr:bifunctional uroporphyrinogen-III C-methyltransferase/uroporphyrinogen-III synthase [Polyangiaceae bacterium]
MNSVFLVGLGPGTLGAATSDARACLQLADIVLIAPGVCRDLVAPLCKQAARILEAEPDPMHEQMLAAARGGELVACVRCGDGWRSDEALRDLRVLHSSGVAFEIVAGIRQEDADWRGWLAQHPLFGRRVVVLRMLGQASASAELLRARGAQPWIVPTIELHPPADAAPLRRAVLSLSTYDVAAFTSTNGVDATFQALHGLGGDARRFGACRVAAIGSATAKALRTHGIHADLVAKEFRGENLANVIVEAFGCMTGRRVLIPRALEAREVLPQLLREAGAEVDVVTAYETRAPAGAGVDWLRAGFAAGQVDAVLLTSSSTVRNLCQMLGDEYQALLGRTCLASIGPITTATARELGLDVAVTAKEFTIPGLLVALEAHLAEG